MKKNILVFIIMIFILGVSLQAKTSLRQNELEFDSGLLIKDTTMSIISSVPNDVCFNII